MKKINSAFDNPLEKDLYLIGLIVAPILAIIFIIYMLSIQYLNLKVPCMFHLVTGLYCPGCGGTRAVNALIHGRIKHSFIYHPLVPYTAFIYLYYMITHTIHIFLPRILKRGARYHDWYLYAALGIVVINWILRNVLLIFYNIKL